MRTRTIETETLANLDRLLTAKREAASASALADKAVKEAVQALGLESDTFLLKGRDGTIEILASFNERSVREIPARVDKFHSFKRVK